MKTKDHTLTAGLIRRYASYLQEQERGSATIQKYTRDLTALRKHLAGAPLTKGALVRWKEGLSQTHAPASVNSMLAAVNGFLRFMGWREMAVKLLKIQRPLFCDEERELSRAEYIRLVHAAQKAGDLRLSLLLQTICATGIRVSELPFITAEAVAAGRAVIVGKGKRRTVFFARKTVPPAAKISAQTKKDRRGGVHHPDGQAHGPEQYLAGHESPV